MMAACLFMLGCQQVSGGCAQRAMGSECSGQASCHLLHIVNHQGLHAQASCSTLVQDEGYGSGTWQAGCRLAAAGHGLVKGFSPWYESE